MASDPKIRASDADRDRTAAALRERMTPFPTGRDDVLDTCGPGGMGDRTFNISTAAAIVAQIRALVGLAWTTEHGTRPLRAADVLVLAPYNAQVLLLREHLAAAGLGDVRVGTVDKFQGTEAPVAIVSMTASSVEDIPRGIPFLLNRNRLNVAISRAQYAAVIVRAETLTDYLPAAPSGLVDLGAFLALTGSGAPT